MEKTIEIISATAMLLSVAKADEIIENSEIESVSRDREDELEASSIQGAPKTQGTILGKSTRGFLGRILDFLGILLIGWAITNLPRIIQGIEGLIKRISSVTGILSLFVDGEFSDEIVDNHGTYSITDGFLEVGAPNYWNGGWSQNGRAEAKWHGNIDDVRFQKATY